MPTPAKPVPAKRPMVPVKHPVKHPVRPVRFSPSEAKLLTILRDESEPIATTDLAVKFYKSREDGAPEHAVATVVSLVRSLTKKTAKDPSVDVKVKRSERRGPYPIRVWLEPR
jgi:hypothetical protein